MNRNLRTIEQFIADGAPFTAHALRALIKRERENGLFEARAILRIGRAVRIDADRFYAWVDAQQAPRPVAVRSVPAVLTQDQAA